MATNFRVVNQGGDIDIIQHAVALLREDMANSPAYEPQRPNYDYREKNLYMARANPYGRALMQTRAYTVSELFYERLLAETREYEQAHQKPFNKGILYANLGISQIYNGKFEHGIAHLLTAEWEDREVNQPGYDILNESLWRQFETRVIFQNLYEWNTYPQAQLGFTIDEPFLDSLFRQMDRQDRIFLQGTLWSLFHNLAQLNVQANAYTLGRLYSGLKDLCLLTESLLRQHQLPTLRPGQQIMLGELLQNALQPHGIAYNAGNPPQGANNLTDFLARLETILALTDPQIRRSCCLLLVRNFTGHHFQIAETVLSPTGRPFFNELFELSYINVIAAIFYLKHIGEI